MTTNDEYQRELDELHAEQAKNLRGLKYSMIGFVIGMALIALASVMHLLLVLGVLH